MKNENDIKTELDLSGVPEVLLTKIQRIEPSKLSPMLIELSKKSVFAYHPDLFDLILSQSNPLSQKIIFEAIDGKLISNKLCINELMYHTDNPVKQQRIVSYSEIPNIFYEEFFLISMLGIEDDSVEAEMRECFKNSLINSTHDFITYKHRFEARSNFAKNVRKLVKNPNSQKSAI